jgi:hypothetical protein
MNFRSKWLGCLERPTEDWIQNLRKCLSRQHNDENALLFSLELRSNSRITLHDKAKVYTHTHTHTPTHTHTHTQHTHTNISFYNFCISCCFFSLKLPAPIKRLAGSRTAGFRSHEVAVILLSPLSLFKQWLTYQFAPRANISYNINLISRDNEVLISRMRGYLLRNYLHTAVYLPTLSISRVV